MENARKRYGLSEQSHLLTVPASLRTRCSRASCLGNECTNWKLCGPSSPFGTYLSHLQATFVSGCDTISQPPSISA
jgi:hypothetical protein